MIIGYNFGCFQVKAFGSAMFAGFVFDETLAQAFPLPLARLYRRAFNAKTPLERHLSALSLWEAGLKLLASVAIVEYAALSRNDPHLAEILRSLVRPSLGHWWEFVRSLLPVLAENGEPAFQELHNLLLGKARDSMPRTAGLGVALRQTLEPGKDAARATVRLRDLFDRLVRYRNTVLLGHGAPGQLKEAFHARMGEAMLAGITELFSQVDVLAKRRLLHIGEVRQVGGVWLVQRFALTGESRQRLATLEFQRGQESRLPDAERIYLDGPGDNPVLRPLHPLLLYDTDVEDVLFLNARRGKGRTEYLCYTTGRTAERPDLGGERRELLVRVMGMKVSEDEAVNWAKSLQDNEDQNSSVQAEDAQPGSAPLVGEFDVLIQPNSSRTLGEFELLSELGKGGMGIVYRAVQPSLGRQVALKKLLRVGDAKTEARFRREIKALGHVEHPNLVKVFTSGSDGDQWFYAMELVEGVTLAAVCDRLRASGSNAGAIDLKTWQETVSTLCHDVQQAEKPLSNPRHVSPDLESPGTDRKPVLNDVAQASSQRPAPPAADASSSNSPASFQVAFGRAYARQIAELIRQAAQAAHALHEKGVIHRDIKPANIMVTADGAHAVLMDLGLAQLADDEEGRLTRTRQFVGTLRYASPEQLGGACIDRRADVYSFGATLWEVLALQPLFGIVEQTPTPDAILRVQQSEPDRLRKYHPGLPKDLEAIAFKCLEKNPRRRYASAADLAQDLARFLNNEAVQARTVRAWERAWKWAKRRPAEAALVVLTFAIIVGLSAATLLLTAAYEDAIKATHYAEDRERDAIQARKVAEEKEEEAIRERKKAYRNGQTTTQIMLYTIGLLQVMDPFGLEDVSFHGSLDNRTRQRARDFLDFAANKALEELDDPVLRASTLDALGHVYRSHGLYDQAQPLLKEGLALRQQHLGVDHEDTATSLYHLGWFYQEQGNGAAAVRLYRQALAIRVKRFGENSIQSAQTMFNLAWALGHDVEAPSADQLQQAEELLRRVVDIRMVKLGKTNPQVGWAKAALATVVITKNEKEGFLLAGQALEILAKAKNANASGGIYINYLLATRKRKEGLLDEADKRYQLVLTQAADAIGDQHPIFGLLLGDYAGLLAQKGDKPGAEKVIRKALDIGRRCWPQGNPYMIDALLGLGDYERDRQQFEEAERLFREALGIAKRFNRPNLEQEAQKRLDNLPKKKTP